MRLTPDGKVDRAFALFWWTLSYRRKMIRSLWLIPFAFLIPLLAEPGRAWPEALFSALTPWGVAGLLAALCVAQAAYYYHLWQKHEANHVPVPRQGIRR